jgi:hypothetical protein
VNNGNGQTYIFNTTTNMRQSEIIRVEENSGGRNWDRLPDVGDFIACLDSGSSALVLRNPV